MHKEEVMTKTREINLLLLLESDLLSCIVNLFIFSLDYFRFTHEAFKPCVCMVCVLIILPARQPQCEDDKKARECEMESEKKKKKEE